MKIHRKRAAALGALATILLTACGSDSSSAGPAEPNKTIAIAATEYRFSGDPSGIVSGDVIRFDVSNVGGLIHEMQVLDPVAFLFNNTNPDGSLEANVASSTISTLSNLEMEKMLEDRHSLSRTVRSAVSPLSEKWGYRLGSVYIRKVAFTDKQMVNNITEKVVKRLVQVTSAMKQDGDNRVGLIRSQTANKVSKTMGEASAARPRIVGEALNAISRNDKELLGSVLEVMETEQLLASDVTIELVPADVPILYTLSGKTTPGATRKTLPDLIPPLP
jgi:hypothetical protein